MATYGKKNGIELYDTSKYGIRFPAQESDYRFPRGHPCYGCFFIRGSGHVLLPPCRDRETCMYAFYEKLMMKGANKIAGKA
jgi:hypothetical protein